MFHLVAVTYSHAGKPMVANGNKVDKIGSSHSPSFLRGSSCLEVILRGLEIAQYQGCCNLHSWEANEFLSKRITPRSSCSKINYTNKAFPVKTQLSIFEAIAIRAVRSRSKRKKGIRRGRAEFAAERETIAVYHP